MVLTIGSWFGEPGVEFRVSHKVHKLIRQLLVDEIMRPYGLEDKDRDTFLGLVITTLSDTEKTEVRGPEYDKRNKFINYGLWLPYKKINNAPNYLETYLTSLFDALVILFMKFTIPESALRAIEAKVKNKALGDNAYTFVE